MISVFCSELKAGISNCFWYICLNSFPALVTLVYKGQKQVQQHSKLSINYLSYLIIIIQSFKLQKMATQTELQAKLSEVTKKLKIICQSYTKLKLQLKSKDDQIAKLKTQIQNLSNSQETKENSKILQIRKKYEIQSTFRPTQKPIPKLNIELDESKHLKSVKSLSPNQFTKLKDQSLEGRIHKDPYKYTQIELKKARTPLNYNINEQKTNSVLPSVIDLSKSRGKDLQLMQIDRRYSKDVKESHHNEAEAQILKQLWQERDKEIKRMDDLFQNLNKKIYNA